VKDTRTGSYILIPAGSTMIGTYKPATSGNAGIQAVEAIFTRIIFPDTSSMDLDAIVAQDNKGEAGIRGKANNHYKAIISAAVLQTLVSTGSALLLNRTGGAAAGGLGYYPSASQAAEAGAANSVNEVGSQFTKRAMNIPVTIHVNAGTVINFELDRDLQFEGPYKDRKPLMSAVQ
jgi:type IV secretion system protein VirB10